MSVFKIRNDCVLDHGTPLLMIIIPQAPKAGPHFLLWYNMDLDRWYPKHDRARLLKHVYLLL